MERQRLAMMRLIFRNSYAIIKQDCEVIVLFFEKEHISFNLLDVLFLDQSNYDIFNSKRNFSALSFRFHSDTVILTDKNEYHLKPEVAVFHH